MSLGLLAFLGRHVRSARLLILATLREEETREAIDVSLAELARVGALTRLPVGPLSRDHTRSLVEWFLPPSPLPEAEVAARVWDLSAGNPFVAVEAVRALAEGSIAALDAAAPLPPRVHDITVNRLRRLPGPARHVLEVAAVVG